MRVLGYIFILFYTLFWGILAQAQSFPEKGVGQLYRLPFADVRLLSCTTGTRGRDLLVGGLQIQIHSGWILKKTHLKTLSKSGVIEYPLQPDPVDTQTYTGTILLPIVYNAHTQDEFGVQGNLIGCWDNNCLDLPIRVSLPLDQQESNYTSYCAYIMDEMGKVPKPVFKPEVGHYIDDHTSILRFHIPKIHQAFLQNQNGLNFKILQTQFWQNTVQFMVSYPEKWFNNTPQDWILITDQGVFRIPVMLSEEALPSISRNKPWGLFVLSPILLFLCSPFFILWGLAFPKTAQKLRQQCLHAMLVVPLLVLGTCIGIWILPDFYSEFRIYILIIMALTLAFPPRFVWWASLLFIIWPKPYLRQMVQNFSLFVLLPWIIWGHIVPFAILYRYAKFWGKKARWSLKKAPFCHCFFFLLPTLVMLFYGIYVVNVEIPYRDVQSTDANIPTVVCEKTDCLTWSEMNFKVHLVPRESDLGKTLLDLYQANQNLIVFNDSGILTVLTDTTPQDVMRYLIGLKNYRAGYRPTDQPVHSGDDLHVPLPNAN